MRAFVGVMAVASLWSLTLAWWVSVFSPTQFSVTLIFDRYHEQWVEGVALTVASVGVVWLYFRGK